MGGGSTIAAAEFCGYESIGVEADETYFDFDMVVKGIAGLAGVVARP